jgi:hypothetical protein
MKNKSIKIPFGNYIFPQILSRTVKRTFVFEGFTFCVHRAIRERSGYKYAVCELGTGRKISTGKSKDSAIHNAYKKLNKQLSKNKDVFHLAINSLPQIN